MTEATKIMEQSEKFIRWLSGRGAQVLQPTNQWELVRFKSGDKTAVIYTNKVGRVRFTGDSEPAWKAFKTGGAWRATPATARKTRRAPEVATLLARDGPLCFFCLAPMDDDMTIEHLVARTHGGPNHISNKFLAHRGCNERAGHLSAPEKIRIHVGAAKQRATY